MDALKRYAEGSADYPFAALHEILLDLLRTEPEIFASPSPPLARILRSADLEAFGGSVGISDTPWNLASLRGLGRAETVAAIMAIGMLLTWSDDDQSHAAKLLRNYLTISPQVIGFVADEVERRTFEGARFDDRLAALLCLDLMLTNGGIAERFLRARGDWLRDDERALAAVLHLTARP